MEIDRFTYEGINYVLGVEINGFGYLKVPYPYFLVTTKSSKKKRERKLGDRFDQHYLRIPIKNPLGFYKRVYSSFNDFLKDYNYVSFTAHRDSKEKREKIYQKALEKMGFNLAYVYKCPWDKSFIQYFMAREGFIPKKKEIKRLIQSEYGDWEEE